MTRMIERWFPCKEVSESSASGWGSGNTERNLVTWFAARPTAQAKAAVICSLLPWPDEPAEQERLQDLVRRSMTGRYAAWDELRRELISGRSASTILDPFSGRGMIPLEAARLGLQSSAIDYAPVAVFATELLADFPFRDWTSEPSLPFISVGSLDPSKRLSVDVEAVLDEVGARLAAQMKEFFPEVDGKQPWGYLWAVTLPCQECNLRFPLVGSLVLRTPTQRKAKRGGIARSDPGQSFSIGAADQAFEIRVHDGPPNGNPTLTNAYDRSGRKIPGKSAICIHCGHVHPLAVHRRLTNDGLGVDALLVVADHDDIVGKTFRTPTADELDAARRAALQLPLEPPFGLILPAIPNESIAPGNNNIIGPSIYGARTFGDFMCNRQTLTFVRLCQVISALGTELIDTGIGASYARALTGYAAANMVRMIRYSTRGAWLRSTGSPRIAGIFVNEGSQAFSYDFFEAGIGTGPGTWTSMQTNTLSTLRDLLPARPGIAVETARGSATSLPYASGSFDVVVTDPPYDQMIAYSDSSDLFFAWLKRALWLLRPDLVTTSDSNGCQEKAEELIVKRVRGSAPLEHRTRQHYDTGMAQAFCEMRRVVKADGVVTIVFGHGEPEVWQRLLSAIASADLVMTGSWPANTESGGQQGKANIETTLTMACRPASLGRPDGRKATVEAEIRAEVKERVPLWDSSGLAPTDMLMAAAGPAMEVVGRYSAVLDARGEQVDISTFLPLARAAVQEAMAVEIDHHPLETFDSRTRFALWWVRLYGRQVVAKSELRWQALAASLDLTDVRDLVPDSDKGCAFAASAETQRTVNSESAVVDVALAMAGAWRSGLDAVGDVLLSAGRNTDDAYLWAAVSFLADKLPDADPDVIAWTGILRNRSGVGSAVKAASQSAKHAADADRQLRFL